MTVIGWVMLLALQEESWFEREAWAKVGERTCLNCHHARGDAAESRFILADPQLDPAAPKKNLEAFTRMASARRDGKARLLAKATGGLDHGGGPQLKPGTTGLRIVEEFVRHVEAGTVGPAAGVPVPFFKDVRMASPGRHLRRLTLSLAGRLPTAAEEESVAKGGAAAVEAALDGILREPAFHDRLREGFNDILLTTGYEGNADDALSYDHFEKTRHWAEKHPLDHVPEKERQKARYKLWDDYRAAFLREPLELISYIVRHDRPFTEIVTADYQMVSPYTARGYGVFDLVKERFRNIEDPFEYVPVRLPALKGRSGRVQESATGFYPHAGILTQFQYLRRYPTTVTNRNRLRSRMYFQHFLGVDVMALAPRVTDAAAIGARFKNPTMEAPDCVVCHTTIDPIAGLFQDYFNEEGHFGPCKEGWFDDMFAPGAEGIGLPARDRWRALQWLGRETAKDPRFAVAMVEHVYQILLGRKVLQAPQDVDDPLFTARRRAWLEQRREVRAIAERFANSGFNLKEVFKAWAASPFYRVDGLAVAAADPVRKAELDDLGLVHLLSPEQVERKVLAVFGRTWGRLKDKQTAILYGGIDAKEVTQRLQEPSGAMGAIQRILANDVACQTVPRDFAKPATERRLFPGIEPDVVPGTPESGSRIRAAIVHLHRRILGREDDPDHPEVERTLRLFEGILEEAAKKGLEPRESYFCRAQDAEGRSADPKYTLRAWRAVVTYLLRQDEFLYE